MIAIKIDLPEMESGGASGGWQPVLFLLSLHQNPSSNVVTYTMKVN